MESTISIGQIFGGGKKSSNPVDDTTGEVAKTTNDPDSYETVDRDVKPAVEHDTVTRQHETREQTVVDRERHQDHYHTTVQPLKDREVDAEKHDAETAPTQERSVDNDTNAADVKAGVDADRSGFKNTREEGQTWENKTSEGTVVNENVHHHYHETVQPVIEKEIVKPSVTHKTIPVHETVQEASKNEGVTVKEPISVDEFEKK